VGEHHADWQSIVEPVTAGFLASLVGLAFAAGAMLFVVFQEIIRESHKRGYQRQATFSTLLGILLMITLAYAVWP